MPALQSHTFVSCLSQNLQKSVPFPTHKEFQNIFYSPSNKNKTPDTQTNSAKKVKRNVDHGLQEQSENTTGYNTILSKKG